MTFGVIMCVIVPVIVMVSLARPKPNNRRSRRGYNSGFMHDSGGGFYGDSGSGSCGDGSSSHGGGGCDSGGGGGDGGGGGGGE